MVALWSSLHGLERPWSRGDGPCPRPGCCNQTAAECHPGGGGPGRHARQPLRRPRCWRKRNTSDERVQKLRDGGIDVDVVAGWSHAATVWQLRRICLDFRPDIVVAHGFSDHLWGRFAALWAGVPCLVHVEHNSRERYTRWRLAQALWLTERTAAIVGCSEGVRQSLQDRGFPAAKLMAISNGIRRALSAGAAPLAAALPGHRHGRALCAARTMPPAARVGRAAPARPQAHADAPRRQGARPAGGAVLAPNWAAGPGVHRHVQRRARLLPHRVCGCPPTRACPSSGAWRRPRGGGQSRWAAAVRPGDNGLPPRTPTQNRWPTPCSRRCR